jgi:MtaA/CmuA family methyltransferase
VTGKQRVINAIKCIETDRTPWVPFVGSHAASLLGITATEYFKSSDLIVKGAQKAIDRYRPDGIPVTFDLQIEAEVFGCEVKYADENPPAVTSHPLCNGTKLEDLSVPTADQGRIKTVLDAAKQIRQANPDIALYATITGPFTLALHLLGTDIFMKMFDDTAYVNDLLTFCNKVACAMSDYYIEAGCDVIAVVDPMTSQIGPDQFEEFITPHATELFDHIRNKNALGSFFVCGHAQQNIEVMCACKPDNISIDENIPLEYVREKCTALNVSFGGNMQLTTVLLLGTPIDAQKNAIACMEIAGEKGFILAPGCDLPYATPPANLEAIIEVVEDTYKRDTVKAMVTEHDESDHLDLTQYGQADKIIVDIVTLDSEACAPCQYMVDAVRKVTPQFDGIVEWREHKIKHPEALQFMTSLMVRNVPTICIDGEITFVSRIPPKDELIMAIQKRINEKFSMLVRQKKATLYVLGTNDDQCKTAVENAEQAAMELGADVHIETITDEKTINSYGVSISQTPAIVMAKYQIKSTKAIPETIIIKEWLKDI